MAEKGIRVELPPTVLLTSCRVIFNFNKSWALFFLPSSARLIASHRLSHHARSKGKTHCWIRVACGASLLVFSDRSMC